MFNLGFPEVFLISAVALLVFGPRRLPELAQGLGKGIRGFKKAIAGELEDNVQPLNLDSSFPKPDSKPPVNF